MANQEPQHPEELNDEENKSTRTTADIQNDANEALKLYQAMASNSESMPMGEEGIFDSSMVLRVDVQGSDSPLVISPQLTIMIGRRDPATGEKPDVDLSTHAAYQMGISRNHALIKWEDSQLFLYDLNSRNGTYVNGKRAIPDQPTKLYDGDELRLGKMALKLYFRKSNSLD